MLKMGNLIFKNIYIYKWKNNPKRQTFYNRLCKVLCYGKKNSCLIEFIDNKEKACISRNALHKKTGSAELLPGKKGKGDKKL